MLFTQVSSLLIAGCSLMELWDLPAADVAFLPDVSSLNEASQYPSCDAGSIGSVVLEDTKLNTAIVVYYTGNYTKACFVCNNGSGYELNTAATERVCQSNGKWSGSPIICGMLRHVPAHASTYIVITQYILCKHQMLL